MKKTVIIYGMVSGMALVLLQTLHYKAIIRDINIEMFGFIIALISIFLGIWLGVEMVNRKNNTIIYKKNTASNNLSAREQEVLLLMADGLSNKEIAERLFVSLNTVKTHNSKIFQKLNVARRTQAVKKAKELEIIYFPNLTSDSAN